MGVIQNAVISHSDDKEEVSLCDPVPLRMIKSISTIDETIIVIV